MTNSFTQGQWSLAWEDGKHGVVAAMSEGKLICIVGNNPSDGKNDERRANAILMAAAPDLLSACENALQLLDPWDWPALFMQLENSVAKARGTAHAKSEAA